MAGKRKIHGGAFKAQVALAAHKGDRTVNDLAGQYGIHPTLIHAWKKQLIAGAVGIFESLGPSKKTAPVSSVRRAPLEAERWNAARPVHTSTLLGTH